MRAVIQRVSEASVRVDARCIGEINRGLLVFLGLQREDTEQTADKMIDKLLCYRLFADSLGKMNQSVVDINGGILLISQFTLAADTNSGRRPSFSAAMPPEPARALFDYCCKTLQEKHSATAFGQFAADMQIQLTNDGPVTFVLDCA